jgi:hypothetical protein
MRKMLLGDPPACLTIEPAPILSARLIFSSRRGSRTRPPVAAAARRRSTLWPTTATVERPSPDRRSS